MVKGSRGTVIALVALFVALGGFAWAATKAPKNSVVSRSIKNGQVKPQDANLVRHVRRAGETTSDGVLAKLAISTRRGDLLSVNTQVDVRKNFSGGFCRVFLELEGPGGLITEIQVAQGETASFTTFYSTTGDDFTNDVDDPLLVIGAIRFPAPAAGRYEFSLFSEGFGSTGCTFRDANIWVEPSR